MKTNIIPNTDPEAVLVVTFACLEEFTDWVRSMAQRAAKKYEAQWAKEAA